jgi:hypothetical protein
MAGSKEGTKRDGTIGTLIKIVSCISRGLFLFIVKESTSIVPEKENLTRFE